MNDALKIITDESLTYNQQLVQLAKVGERVIDVISTEELKRLLKTPDLEENPEKRARGHAILELLLVLN